MEQKTKLSGRTLAVGTVAMGASNALKVTLQLVMLPVMARLLGPSEFGLYALAMPTVTFLQMLAGAGLGNSLSREAESSEEVWSTAFWMVHGLSVILVAIVVIWSFVLSKLSHQPRLPPIMAALSLSLLFLATSILPSARLIRRAQMAVGAAADLFSSVVGAVVALSLALNHAGVWSLVAQYITGFAVDALLLNLRAPMFPRFQFNARALSPHIAVGGSIVASKLSDFFGRLVENTMLSNFLGAAKLGIYSFGNQVPRFVCEAASNPIWHGLYVQAIHADREVTISRYYQAVRLLSLVLIPSTMVGAVLAPRLLPMLLGPAWSASIPIIVIILPSYALAVIGQQSSAMLYAYGRGDVWLWITAGLAVSRVLAVAVAPIAGLLGVAAGISLSNILYACACVFVTAPIVGYKPWRVVGETRGAFVSAACAAAACFWLSAVLPHGLGGMIAAAGVAVVAYLGMLLLVEGRKLARDIAALRRMLSSR
jgi:O-antigen/teichoic acid export membrane protein